MGICPACLLPPAEGRQTLLSQVPNSRIEGIADLGYADFFFVFVKLLFLAATREQPIELIVWFVLLLVLLLLLITLNFAQQVNKNV